MKIIDPWIFISILPNLFINIPIETKYAAIVSQDDPRISSIKEKYPPVRDLLSSFININGATIKPAVLIVSKKVFRKKERHAAVVAFRNIAALCIILDGWIPVVHAKQPNVSTTLFSDYYELFLLNGYNEKYYFVKSPALHDVIYKAKLKYQPNYSLPDTKNFFLFYDNKLFNALIKLWEEYFIYNKKEHQYSALLRSLQMAYSACKMATDNFSTLYDYGTKIGLWVSAFEILFHPGGSGTIRLADIIAKLNKYEFGEPKLQNCRFNVWINKKLILDSNILGLIYKNIYDTRNDFFHGNSIERSKLHLFNLEKLPPLTHILPVIYLTALQIFLQNNDLLPKAEKINNDFSASGMVDYLMKDRIEKIFLKIIRSKIFEKNIKLVSPTLKTDIN
ncbi:MAG: hypothetical protein HF314_14070 [Ignavibacteria bacterium]|jgi:hypothetical protein|nr:hypothetical protein [Ignavibacteria bacterium]MCU7504205.1 hypothetical protein [Ignavibacteria bacterium]MCU7518130.1 hypothetical protein [Ignavibacteria bacterium]